MATARQIQASRRNGSLSKGPVSEEGRLRSRANSLKHGLAGEGVVLTPDDAEAVARRMAEWRKAFRIVDARDEWLFEQAVVSSVQIDHCHRLESALHADLARRAAICWDDDRRGSRPRRPPRAWAGGRRWSASG
jgi:hypothetical protein